MGLSSGYSGGLGGGLSGGLGGGEWLCGYGICMNSKHRL